MDYQEEVIYCRKCGAPMKKSQRCCMKCGALNYDHPENQSMKSYQPKEKKQKFTYVSPSSSVFSSTPTITSSNTSSFNVSAQSKMTSTEKKYRMKHIILGILIILIVVAVIYFFSPYLIQLWNQVSKIFMKIFSDFKETVINSN